MATSDMPRPWNRGMKLVALGCTLLLSCTTVRTHLSTVPGEVVVEGGQVEPQVDLWVESNKPLTPEEEERYRAEVRSALEQALAGHAEPEGDALLVVRTQGVTRTPARRSDQTGAAVGLAVGAVLIVAAVILIAVSGSKGSSHHSGGGSKVKAPSGSAPRVARVPGARAGASPPRFAAAPPRPAGAVGAPPRPPTIGAAPRPPGPPPPRPVPHPPPPSIGHHPHGDGGGGVAVGVDVWVPVYVEPPPPGEEAPPEHVVVRPPDAEPAAPPDATTAAVEPPPAPETTRFPLAPPEPFPVEERGFFDGDRLKIEALLLDRRSGEVLWVKRVSRSADPRDPKAVKAAIDELLKDGGWSAPAPAGS
jgi:hypothetical protein